MTVASSSMIRTSSRVAVARSKNNCSGRMRMSRGRTAVRQAAAVSRRTKGRAISCTAKYGENNQYFDLDDLENTTGAWDRYGNDDPKRYPDQQSDFFERAAEPLTRRETMFTFLGVVGAIAFAAYGAVGAKDAKLPITVGPQKPAVVGPRNRL